MDVYRRSGRGGAGNFYSPQDIEDVTKSSSAAAASAPADSEAQRQQPLHLDTPDNEPLPSDPVHEARQVLPSSAHASASATNATSPPDAATATTTSYVRSGRGGAGNFVDAATAQRLVSAPAPKPAAASVAPGTAAAAPAALGRHSGRGGAGNWSWGDDEQQRRREEDEERRQKAALDARVSAEVVAGLQPPTKAYHMQGHHGPRGLPDEQDENEA